MSLYSLAVFLHIVGALGLFAALGLEWAGVQHLRRAATTSQAREWVKLVGDIRLLERPSLLVLFATGLHAIVTTGSGRPLIGPGLVGILGIAALGALLTRRRIRSVERVLAEHDGLVTPALACQLADPVLQLSAALRTALALGVVFVMSTRPHGAGALSALAIALVLGLAAGLPPLLRRSRPRSV